MIMTVYFFVDNTRQVPGIEGDKASFPTTNSQYIVDNEDFVRQEVTKYHLYEVCTGVFT